MKRLCPAVRASEENCLFQNFTVGSGSFSTFFAFKTLKKQYRANVMLELIHCIRGMLVYLYC